MNRLSDTQPPTAVFCMYRVNIVGIVGCIYVPNGELVVDENSGLVCTYCGQQEINTEARAQSCSSPLWWRGIAYVAVDGVSRMSHPLELLP